jgi:FkbM family methyltransferase
MYYSQVGQDRFLNEFVFLGKTNGTFIDIGAHNGISYSNSYFFEKELNWEGICVEPNPSVFNELQSNRKSKCINACISSDNGKVKFRKISGRAEMLSGIVLGDKKQEDLVENEIKKYGGQQEIIEVESVKIADIINKEGIQHIDFCSIDTEGHELEVLKSIDFEKTIIEVFAVENESKEVRKLLRSKGYKLAKRIGRGDEFYLRKNGKYRFTLKNRIKWRIQERVKTITRHFKKSFNSVFK